MEEGDDHHQRNLFDGAAAADQQAGPDSPPRGPSLLPDEQCRERRRDRNGVDLPVVAGDRDEGRPQRDKRHRSNALSLGEAGPPRAIQTSRAITASAAIAATCTSPWKATPVAPASQFEAATHGTRPGG